MRIHGGRGNFRQRSPLVRHARKCWVATSNTEQTARGTGANGLHREIKETSNGRGRFVELGRIGWERIHPCSNGCWYHYKYDIRHRGVVDAYIDDRHRSGQHRRGEFLFFFFFSRSLFPRLDTGRASVARVVASGCVMRFT